MDDNLLLSKTLNTHKKDLVTASYTAPQSSATEWLTPEINGPPLPPSCQGGKENDPEKWKLEPSPNTGASSSITMCINDDSQLPSSSDPSAAKSSTIASRQLSGRLYIQYKPIIHTIETTDR